MDTHDASNIPECMEALRKQKRNLQNAQALKGQRPTWTTSRPEVIMRFMLHRLMLKNTDAPPYVIRSSFVPPAYPPCTSQLSDLKKVMIKDLLVETHHRGSYLLLRTITPADRMTALIAIVEDEDGSAITIQLYNQETTRPESDILDQGAVLAVKEPYLKVMSDGEYGLRVDHLSDVIFIPNHDMLVPSAWITDTGVSKMPAYDWRMKGNDLFNQSRYYRAIECYSKALECPSTDDEAYTIRLNRVLAFLRTSQFDAALRDLENVPAGCNPSEKALFRTSQALYHLQRFRECCEVLKVICKGYPENASAKREFTRALGRLAEQENGRYDFKAMQMEAAKQHPPHLDHATYVGPVLFKPADSRGRGLFTTKAVKAGDLLICEKAFAHAFVDTASPSPSTQVLINTETNAMSLGGQAELVPQIVQKLYKNVSLMPTITDLHHGSYSAVDVSHTDDSPVVDTFFVERVMSLNGFGCPVSSRESHIHGMSGGKMSEGASKQFDTCAIWPMASYINHSCVSNARRSFIGDMMIVRATEDLDADTEVVFWYKSPFDSEPGKQQMDFGHWGFKCSCVMCQDLHATGDITLAKRKRLRANVLKSIESRKNPNGAKIEAIMSELANTYGRPALEVPRVMLWDLYIALSRVYAVENQPEKAINTAVRALESLGYVIDGGTLPPESSTPLTVKKWGLMADSLVGCWMILSGLYREVAPDLAASAKGYATLTYRICVGEDETFESTVYRHLC